MPDVRNCRKCGKVYTYIGGPPICPVCIEQDEADFRRVKEYLYQYPGASMTEVSTVLDVSAEKITRYLKDGRLEIVGDTNLILECEGCGKPIRTGRYCNECQNGLTKDLKNTARQMSELTSNNPKPRHIEMRFLNKDSRK